MKHAFLIDAAVSMRAKIIALRLEQVRAHPSRFNEFGLRLRFRDWETVFAEAFDMHGNSGANICMNLFQG
jgi:hypothetical protein